MPTMYMNDMMPLHYEVTGEGKPILFVHPTGMGLVTFKHQHPLAKNYKIITFDLRGNGKSGFTNEPITIPLLAKDIKMLLDHLHMKRVVICGYSNGGSVSLEFALTYPDYVDGIILIGGFPKVSTFLLRSQYQAGISLARFNGTSILAKTISTSHGVSKPYTKELEEYYKMSNPNILYQMYQISYQYDCTNRLDQIRVPFLLVYGEKDQYLHAYQSVFKQFIKQTEIVHVQKARHQIPTKFHKELNGVITQFMKTYF